jgi:hypothetical protein
LRILLGEFLGKLTPQGVDFRIKAAISSVKDFGPAVTAGATSAVWPSEVKSSVIGSAFFRRACTGFTGVSAVSVFAGTVWAAGTGLRPAVVR